MAEHSSVARIVFVLCVLGLEVLGIAYWNEPNRFCLWQSDSEERREAKMPPKDSGGKT